MAENKASRSNNAKSPARTQPNNKPPSKSQSQKPSSSKLRGLPRDSPEIRLSKTLSWLLRHGAQSEGLAMRPDGYVKVADLLANPRLQGTDIEALKTIVEKDSKTRYNLLSETDGESSTWLIRANQGHSLKSVEMELVAIQSVTDIPTGLAVHGTTLEAWQSISKQGLSKMTRNHIHLAQGVAGENVISGMRKSSQILIFIDIQKALDAGIKFFLSDNGVVLTAGDDNGFLSPEFFKRVEDAKRNALPGWEGAISANNVAVSSTAC